MGSLQRAVICRINCKEGGDALENLPVEPLQSVILSDCGMIITKKFAGLAGMAVKRLLGLHRVNHLSQSLAKDSRTLPLAAKVLDHLRISYRVSDLDLARIPRSGPLVVVANHPFGAVEGLILASMFFPLRPDTRIMANYLLQQIDLPGFREMFLFVDPFARKTSPQANIGAMRNAVQWLRRGGVLGVFPAGEVSHLQMRRRRIADPNWKHAIGRLVTLARAPVLPVFFEGANSLAFQLLGLIHPRLRTLMLPRQVFNKTGREIRVRIGKRIPFERLARLRNPEEVSQFLRLRTQMLASPGETLTQRAAKALRTKSKERPYQALTAPRKLHLLPEEVKAIPLGDVLVENETFQVFHARAHQIPLLLHEIGRWREITFRAAGEGTGKAIDLDEFDQHYLHLVLWDKTAQELAGGYRLGVTDEILEQYGAKGLYTSSLFKYSPGFLQAISPAIELGRSFVRREYQKSYQPLMLLWKGIGSFVAARPRYRVLFGPVSISNQYHWISRELIVAFSMSCQSGEFSQYVRGNRPHMTKLGKKLGIKLPGSLMENLQDLSDLVAGIERNGEGIPILLKHYLKLGGKFLGFSIDRNFSNVMDALIMVDLTEADRTLLERYMGKKGLNDFWTFHECGPLRACA